MKLSSISITIILLFSIAFISCKKVSPQLPSNKGIENDHNAQNLLEINKKLANKEDRLLEIYVKKQNKSFYIKNELGFWYTINKKTNGKKLRKDELCKINYSLKLISGKTVLNESKEFTIGKKEVIVGLEEGVKILNKGEKATFLIPWYLGYGMQGLDNKVPPYTSIIYEVELKE
ncbi:MAG: FKBP-type peptidyl-prolyl cis-trans isomerase [Paludibacter sp.]|nr:FKBP-type peptidyl-prolyl cis-trans isomerase [Paludibacter sp.]